MVCDKVDLKLAPGKNTVFEGNVVPINEHGIGAKSTIFIAVFVNFLGKMRAAVYFIFYNNIAFANVKLSHFAPQKLYFSYFFIISQRIIFVNKGKYNAYFHLKNE